MMTWDQKGFVLTSEAPGGMPITHGFYLARWEAEAAQKKAVEALPPECRVNLQIVPATLIF